MKRLQNWLPAGDCALLVTEISRRYLTGFPSSLGYLFVTRENATLYVDGRYFEAATAHAQHCEVKLLRRLRDHLAEVEQTGVKRFLCETELTVATVQTLSACTSLPVTPSAALTDFLHTLRAVKTPDEVGRIVAAQRIAERAFCDLLEWLRPGVTEREVALELDYRMRRFGADGLSFETIAVSGPNSSMPHGVPGDRALTNGDFLTMDFGAVCDGYHSDMTRTVAIGGVTDEMRRVYDTVLRAQAAALDALRPGATTAEIDAAARDVITAAGYGEAFTHSTGHGVGLEIHEGPNLSARGAESLQPGQIVTVEPGIYLPGRFGVRIEDMACITPDGFRNLTNARKDLIILSV